MGDIVLVKLETKESQIERYRYFPPFGILYLAHELEKKGFTVKLIHQEGTKTNIHSLVELVAEEDPIFVGLSTLTGQTIIPTVEASIAIKKRCKTPIVWGGHHSTILPEHTLLNEFVDIIVLGEGERTIVELAKVIREYGMNPQKLAGVAGIGFKDGKQPILIPPRPFIENLDELYPAWHHLDINKYFYTENLFRAREKGKTKAATVITSRGCPWRCSYCYNQKVNKRIFRAQSAERSIRDILELKDRFNINGVLFEDDNFFTNKKRAMEIIQQIKMPWSSSIRASDLVEGGGDFVKALMENKCMELRIGAESGSQRILNLLNKDLTVEQIRESARLCERYEITAAYMFLVGFPGEEWSDICETLDLIDDLSRMNHYVMVTHLGSYTPYPGTPLYDEAIKMGFEPPHSTIGWGNFVKAGYRGYLPKYVNKKARSLTYYYHMVIRNDLDDLTLSLPAKLIQRLARLRWKHRFFSFPIDHYVPVSCLKGFEKAGFHSLSRKLYKR